jgi:hypothetical protein
MKPTVAWDIHECSILREGELGTGITGTCGNTVEDRRRRTRYLQTIQVKYIGEECAFIRDCCWLDCVGSGEPNAIPTGRSVSEYPQLDLLRLSRKRVHEL